MSKLIKAYPICQKNFAKENHKLIEKPSLTSSGMLPATQQNNKNIIFFFMADFSL